MSLDNIRRHLEFILSYSQEIANKDYITAEDLDNFSKEIIYFKKIVIDSNIALFIKTSLLEVEFNNSPAIGYINYENSKISNFFLIFLRFMMVFSQYQSNKNQYQIEYQKMLFDFYMKYQNKINIFSHN